MISSHWLLLLLVIIPIVYDDVEAWTSKNPISRKRKVTRRCTKILSTIGEACGLIYDEPVFRPPAEWKSLILQVTIGCSWNKCTFCEMYQDKEFSAKGLDDIERELARVVNAGGSSYVRDVFLADGDAMTMPISYLTKVLDLINKYLPNVRRISSYCLPRNIRDKSVANLTKLRRNGLKLVYIGCESGSNQVLNAIEKGETYDTSLDALNKLQEAGIKRSVMILLGLGGLSLSEDHAIKSAMLCNHAEPELLSVLTTSFPRGMRRIEDGFLSNSDLNTTFLPLSPRQGLEELELFLQNLHLTSNKTIFRSDHASNYFALKGRLGRDKSKLLSELRTVLDSPPDDDVYNLRPEWARGL